MPQFIIREHADYTVDADTAQEALDKFLNEGPTNPDFGCTVNERWVLDEAGDDCEVSE